MKHKGPMGLGYSSAVIQGSVPLRMSIACSFACIFGIILMAATGIYPLVGVYGGILLSNIATGLLYKAQKISLDTACLIPMSLLCFLHTPISWYMLGGLLGPTPYLSLLYGTLIVLTYYRKKQAILLFLYGVLMLGLTIHWLASASAQWETWRVIHVLAAYMIAVTLIVLMVEGVKRKNLEINKNFADLSMRDDLTGLFNRRATEPILSELERDFREGGAEYAVVMLDIDQFKVINDSYGHTFGDSALKTLAQCVLKSLRSTDYAFRLGGDEFLLVLPNVDESNLNQICARIQTALSEVQGYAFSLVASMGCALRSEGASGAAVLELADQRMYRVKRGREAQRQSTG